MRFIFIILLFNLSVFAQEEDSFITESEYAQDLYKNPRGIGCNNCHGKNGEGMTISKYKEKGENMALKTKSIKDLSYEDFNKAFKKSKGVMPKYFLTKQEILTLYTFLHVEKKEN